jgi:hypothetical protein
VSRLRTESKFYRRVSAWNDFYVGILSGGFSAGRAFESSGRRSSHC